MSHRGSQNFGAEYALPASTIGQNVRSSPMLQGCSSVRSAPYCGDYWDFASGRASRLGTDVGRLGRAHDQQVAGTVVGDLVGDAAQQEPLTRLRALIADHDEIGVDLLGYVKDDRCGVAQAGIGLRGNAGPVARSAAALSLDRTT